MTLPPLFVCLLDPQPCSFSQSIYLVHFLLCYLEPSLPQPIASSAFPVDQFLPVENPSKELRGKHTLSCHNICEHCLYILLLIYSAYIFLYILPYLVYLGCDFFGPKTVLTSTLHVVRAGVHSWDMHRPYYNIITNFNSKQSLKWFQLYNTRFRDL